MEGKLQDVIEQYVKSSIDTNLKRYNKKSSTGETYYVGKSPEKDVLDLVANSVAKDLADIIAMGIFYGSDYIDEHFEEDFSENLTKQVAKILKTPNF